jgi:hypothetical protein
LLNATASHQDTFSTGQSSPHAANWDGLVPVTAVYSPWVISVMPTRRGVVNATRRAGRSSSLHASPCPRVQPIKNVPGSTYTMSTRFRVRAEVGAGATTDGVDARFARASSVGSGIVL